MANTFLSDKTRVGCIGLGIMGLPAAKNLQRAGYTVSAYARRPESTKTLGGTVASYSSPKELGAVCDVVVINVSDTPDVEEVTLGKNGLVHGMKPGSAIIDMSTISPATTRHVAEKLAEKDITFLDAPVSGGQKGAIDGTLTIMVGGSVDMFTKAQPLLAAMGKTITHIGTSGAGQVAKACNQIIIGATIEGVAEAMVLAQKNGVDAAAVREALLGGFAGSKVLEMHAPRMLHNNFTPGFKSVLHEKDMKIALTNGGENNLSLPAAELFLQRLQALIALGGGDLDSTAIYKVITGEKP